MRWEYQTLKIDTKGFSGGKFDEHDVDQQLNELGAEGWELIKAFDTNMDVGATRSLVFVFKRQA